MNWHLSQAFLSNTKKDKLEYRHEILSYAIILRYSEPNRQSSVAVFMLTDIGATAGANWDYLRTVWGTCSWEGWCTGLLLYGTCLHHAAEQQRRDSCPNSSIAHAQCAAQRCLELPRRQMLKFSMTHSQTWFVSCDWIILSIAAPCFLHPPMHRQLGSWIVRKYMLLSGQEGAVIRHWTLCLLTQGSDTCATHPLPFMQEHTHAAVRRHRKRKDQTQLLQLARQDPTIYGRAAAHESGAGSALCHSSSVSSCHLLL